MILFFDTETTGLPQNYNAPVSDSNNWPRLVQLAFIKCDWEGNIISQSDFIIKPDGFTIPAGLFGCSTDNMGLHLKNIFKIKELEEHSVTGDFPATAAQGIALIRLEQLSSGNAEILLSAAIY